MVKLSLVLMAMLILGGCSANRNNTEWNAASADGKYMA